MLVNISICLPASKTLQPRRHASRALTGQAKKKAGNGALWAEESSAAEHMALEGHGQEKQDAHPLAGGQHPAKQAAVRLQHSKRPGTTRLT